MIATDTSLAARMDTASAMILREMCLDVLKDQSCTADEVAQIIGQSVLATRPRISELHSLGVIRDSLKRRANASGHKAIVWELSTLNQPEFI